MTAKKMAEVTQYLSMAQREAAAPFLDAIVTRAQLSLYEDGSASLHGYFSAAALEAITKALRAAEKAAKRKEQ